MHKVMAMSAHTIPDRAHSSSEDGVPMQTLKSLEN